MLPNIDQRQPQTLEEALAIIDELRGQLRDSYEDPVWGILSRQGMERRLSELSGLYAAIVADLDHLHSLNDQLTHEGVDTRMRQVLGLRDQDVFYGRWKRGDEFVAIVPIENVIGLATRLQGRLIALGLSATFAVVWDPSHASIAYALDRIGHMKHVNMRGDIHVYDKAGGWVVI